MATTQKIHFEISERKILLRILDFLFVIFFLYIVGYFFNFDYFNVSIDNVLWTIVLGFYLSIVGTVFEMYNLQNATVFLQITRSCLLTASVTTLLYFLTPVFTPILPDNRLQIIYFFFSVLGGLLFWRILYLNFFAKNRFVKNVVVLGNSTSINQQISDIQTNNINFVIKGFLPLDNKKIQSKVEQLSINELEDFVEKNTIKEIIVANETQKEITFEIYQGLLGLLEKGVVIQKYSDVYESVNYRLPLHFDDSELYRFFPFSRNNKNRLYLLYNRVLDIIFSVIGIALMAFITPFLLLVNLFWNKGKLFYKQTRVGINGKEFCLIKFRTMIKDAEKDGAVFAKVNDVRITPFGKFLRKSRIDELPQFINVLKGEMSLIGSRPERPVFVEEIAKEIHLYKTRHIIKPGLTGWAQVNYPYGENIEDSLMKLRYDLYYIKHRSIFLDFNIMLKTFSTVLFFRGQ